MNLHKNFQPIFSLFRNFILIQDNLPDHTLMCVVYTFRMNTKVFFFLVIFLFEKSLNLQMRYLTGENGEFSSFSGFVELENLDKERVIK